ncbi:MULTISPECIES: hypothetical protein [unclassified Campylobacter]|nr:MULTISPECIES: hypothetical protein [unclassified Campylobacter]
MKKILIILLCLNLYALDYKNSNNLYEYNEKNIVLFASIYEIAKIENRE